MSLAKDKFFELLVPDIEMLGYKFKKSKGSFERIQGDLCYSILFSWDGRGGTTYFNDVIGKVHIPKILNVSKKLTNIHYEANIYQDRSVYRNEFAIPQMYSKQLIDLANWMRFKEMAAMPFEEKYPIEKITKTVEAVKKKIIHYIIPFLNTVNGEADIFNWYVQKAQEQVNSKGYFNICYYAIPIKLMCKKSGIEEPDFIKEINFFTKESIDELWNIQSIDFDSLKERFDAIVF